MYKSVNRKDVDIVMVVPIQYKREPGKWDDGRKAELQVQEIVKQRRQKWPTESCK